MAPIPNPTRTPTATTTSISSTTPRPPPAGENRCNARRASPHPLAFPRMPCQADVMPEAATCGDHAKTASRRCTNAAAAAKWCEGAACLPACPCASPGFAVGTWPTCGQTATTTVTTRTTAGPLHTQRASSSRRRARAAQHHGQVRAPRPGRGDSTRRSEGVSYIALPCPLGACALWVRLALADAQASRAHRMMWVGLLAVALGLCASTMCPRPLAWACMHHHHHHHAPPQAGHTLRRHAGDGVEDGCTPPHLPDPLWA